MAVANTPVYFVVDDGQDELLTPVYLVVDAYDPNQPRDEKGRWAKVSAAFKKALRHTNDPYVALTAAGVAFFQRDEYNPDQPRVPAGSPDGGQWTSNVESFLQAHIEKGHGWHEISAQLWKSSHPDSEYYQAVKNAYFNKINGIQVKAGLSGAHSLDNPEAKAAWSKKVKEIEEEYLKPSWDHLPADEIDAMVEGATQEAWESHVEKYGSQEQWQEFLKGKLNPPEDSGKFPYDPGSGIDTPAAKEAWFKTAHEVAMNGGEHEEEHDAWLQHVEKYGTPDQVEALHAGQLNGPYTTYGEPPKPPAVPLGASRFDELANTPGGYERAMNTLARRATADPDALEPYINATQSYTGSGYEDINNALRHTGYYSPDWREGTSGLDTLDPHTRETIMGLDAALAKSHAPEDLVLYRGFGRSTTSRLRELEAGDLFEDRGFVSASLSRNTAENFSSRDSQIEIEVPHGYNALPLNWRLSSHEHEAEVLLPRGTRFEVVRAYSPSSPMRIRVVPYHER